jgi:hypothetical protein
MSFEGSRSLHETQTRVTMIELDAVLTNPRAYAHLPQSAWAFDPATGTCRRVRWASTTEPWPVRRTALAVALVQAA